METVGHFLSFTSRSLSREGPQRVERKKRVGPATRDIFGKLPSEREGCVAGPGMMVTGALLEYWWERSTHRPWCRGSRLPGAAKSPMPKLHMEPVESLAFKGPHRWRQCGQMVRSLPSTFQAVEDPDALTTHQGEGCCPRRTSRSFLPDGSESFQRIIQFKEWAVIRSYTQVPQRAI